MLKHEDSPKKYELLYEQRMTRVETILENMDRDIRENFKEIKGDLRWLLGLMIAFSGTILGLMAKGFNWL